MNQADERRQWVLEALDEHEGRLTRYALRMLGDADLARDAVQHAFLKLCEQSRAQIGTRLAAWLYTVCRNRATDLLRTSARERQTQIDQDNRLTAANVDPAFRAEEADLHGLLRKLIVRLPASQREAVDLWAEGFSYAEIARIVERHEGHIRVLVHRGLKAVREHPQVRSLLIEEAPQGGVISRG